MIGQTLIISHSNKLDQKFYSLDLEKSSLYNSEVYKQLQFLAHASHLHHEVFTFLNRKIPKEDVSGTVMVDLPENSSEILEDEIEEPVGDTVEEKFRSYTSHERIVI